MFHVRSSAEVKLLLTQSCTTARMPAVRYGSESCSPNVPAWRLGSARGDSGQMTTLEEGKALWICSSWRRQVEGAEKEASSDLCAMKKKV